MVRTRKQQSGITIVELALSMALSTLVVLTSGILLVNGHKSWQRTYDQVNDPIRQDARMVMIAFGAMGRKANRLNYTIYERINGQYVKAMPQMQDTEELVYGEAVEFRYWDVPLDQQDSHNLLNESKTATAYAFFYIENDQLRVDYGDFPPGAVVNGLRNTTNVKTVTLAENVSQPDMSHTFSHTMLNDIGQGCVRIDLYLEDGQTGKSTHVKTATMLRNVWPK